MRYLNFDPRAAGPRTTADRTMNLETAERSLVEGLPRDIARAIKLDRDPKRREWTASYAGRGRSFAACASTAADAMRMLVAVLMEFRA